MKALKYLKDEKEYLKHIAKKQKIIFFNEELDEAITELEELDNRSCESCKHIDSGPYDVCPIAEPISRQWLNYDKEAFSCNRWEKK